MKGDVMRSSYWALALASLLVASNALADAPEGRVQVDVTGGVVLPGNMTPKQVFPTHTGAGPIVRLETGFAPIANLEFGPYLSLSSHPVTAIDGFAAYDQSGSIFVMSAGAGVKARFALTSWFTMRLGVYVGLNYTSAFIAHTKGGGEAMPGIGLGVGPLVDFRFKVAPHFAVLAQIGFVSQPAGTAIFPADTSRPNESVGFAYPPMMFFNLGPELFF
jgi:hypothetical protein